MEEKKVKQDFPGAPPLTPRLPVLVAVAAVTAPAGWAPAAAPLITGSGGSEHRQAPPGEEC